MWHKQQKYNWYNFTLHINNIWQLIFSQITLEFTKTIIESFINHIPNLRQSTNSYSLSKISHSLAPSIIPYAPYTSSQSFSRHNPNLHRSFSRHHSKIVCFTYTDHSLNSIQNSIQIFFEISIDTIPNPRLQLCPSFPRHYLINEYSSSSSIIQWTPLWIFTTSPPSIIFSTQP